MSTRIPALPMSGAALHQALDWLRAATPMRFAQSAEMRASDQLAVGDLCHAAERLYGIVPAGSFAANGDTVQDLTGIAGQAVLAPGEPLADVAALLADARPASWLGATTRLRTLDGGRYETVASGAHLTTAGGVGLQVRPEAGRVDLRAYGLGAGGTLPQALQQAMATAGAAEIAIPEGLWPVSEALDLRAERDVWIHGAGRGATTLRLAQAIEGLRVRQGNWDADTRAHSVRISDLRVEREDPEGYAGAIGPKSVMIHGADRALVERVDERHAIGFGISVAASNRGVIRDCTARDHKGGVTGPNGTDGLHVHECEHAEIRDCAVSGVGDDAISVGSHLAAYPVRFARIQGNHAAHAKGSVKFHGPLRNGKILDNYMEDLRNGAWQLTTDSAGAPAGVMEDIEVAGNDMRGCIGFPNTGASFYYPSGSGRIHGFYDGPDFTFRNVHVHHNTHRDCRDMLVLGLDKPSGQVIESLRIEDNYMEGSAQDPMNTAQKAMLFFISEVRDRLVIRRNRFRDITGCALLISEEQYAPFPPGSLIEVADLDIDGWGGVGQQAVISLARARHVIRGLRCRRHDATGGQREIAYVPFAFPNSEFSDFSDDGTAYGIPNLTGGSRGWRSATPALKAGAAPPTAGSHAAGQRYPAESPVPGGAGGWLCGHSGTLKPALSGVTASTVSGSRTVSFNTVADFEPGDFIDVAGVPERWEIARVDAGAGSAEMVRPASATLSGAAVSWALPVFYETGLLGAAGSADPGMRVAVPAGAAVAGRPGQWAADDTHHYTYTGDGSSHAWRRVAHAAW